MPPTPSENLASASSGDDEALLEGHTWVRLADGTEALVRPIRRDGGPALATALQELSPRSRYQRFLSHRAQFSEAELKYLTDCDGIQHIALVLAVRVEGEAEPRPVAVARCIRDRADPTLAEAALVVHDGWQGRGVGRTLLQVLAHRAWKQGIRCWSGLLLAENRVALRMLDYIGKPISRAFEDGGAMRVVYRLHSPNSVETEVEIPSPPGEAAELPTPNTGSSRVSRRQRAIRTIRVGVRWWMRRFP